MSKQKVNHNYLGMQQRLSPEWLNDFEDRGFVLEEKHDGWWCCASFINGYADCSSRHGNFLEDATRRLMHWLEDPLTGIIIGEWMPEQQIMWAFDLISLDGVNLRSRPLSDRRKLLEDVVGPLNPAITITPQFKKGFKLVYEAIVADGGEGVVLKHEDSIYKSHLASKKTSLWLKCKPAYARPSV